jgi:outer membrane protein OmpA-like peptidoglycan-associated protein
MVTGLVAVGLTLASCASWGNRETGAVVGAAAGGAVGGVIGTQSGSTARGAIIGAVVGGAAGAIIGHQMDQQAEELEAGVPGAIVERVGEGIHITFPSGLLFDFDSNAIRPDAAAHLRTLASSLDEYPDTQLLIVGHTDSVGSESYNQDLSVRRATPAMAFLTGQGVSAQQRITPPVEERWNRWRRTKPRRGGRRTDAWRLPSSRPRQLEPLGRMIPNPGRCGARCG